MGDHAPAAVAAAVHVAASASAEQQGRQPLQQVHSASSIEQQPAAAHQGVKLSVDRPCHSRWMHVSCHSVCVDAWHGMPLALCQRSNSRRHSVLAQVCSAVQFSCCCGCCFVSACFVSQCVWMRHMLCVCGATSASCLVTTVAHISRRGAHALRLLVCATVASQFSCCCGCWWCAASAVGNRLHHSCIASASSVLLC